MTVLCVLPSNYLRPCSQKLHHLPDPMPDETREGHYKPFFSVYGTETTEKHLPTLNENLRRNHGIPFSPVVQHAKKTGITIACASRGKPRVVYSHLKAQCIRKFKNKTCDMIFTCGTTVVELVPELTTLFIRSNLECYVPVEPLQYSAGYQNCCCHCGGTDRLKITKYAYPICQGCIDYHQKKLS